MYIDEESKNTKKGISNLTINGFFSPSTPTLVLWKSRRRSSSGRMMKVKNKLNGTSATKSVENKDSVMVDAPSADTGTEKQQELSGEDNNHQESNTLSVLSEKRKALFEPLEPTNNVNGKRPSVESLLPPPDFESASYPRGWLIGKKRKLVNVDVVESMRRIAVQEMNRKDREINGLNEQLEEDARCLEHLQLQLLEEHSKRADVERQNAMLQNQITMLMNMLQENDPEDDEAADEP